MSHLAHMPSSLPPVVAILGGSFNPAHAGHIHISQAARRLLGIDHIWWMVSPQNPLKSTLGMADFDTRFEHACQLSAPYPFIHVSDIEYHYGSNHTARTLAMLRTRYPRTRFVWLMGADNLATIHRWEKWTRIFKLCPILVLDRAPLSHRALHSKAAIRYKEQRIMMRAAQRLTHGATPLWCFAHIKKHPESATHLRKTLGKKAFLR